MSGIDPIIGPSEEEALEAAGTSVEEIDRLAAALGVPASADDVDVED